MNLQKQLIKSNYANIIEVFKNTLIELSKVNAPALKLYEFNYYFNKAVDQYVNQVYNIYDVNQQTTDDLRVLQGSVTLTPKKVKNSSLGLITDDEKATLASQMTKDEDGKANDVNYLTAAHNQLSSIDGAAYECWLPMDYLHVLNCVCIFEVTKPYDCYDAGTFIAKPATRLTADSWPLIMDDIYNRPSPEKPYFQIYNQNRTLTDVLPTDPVTPITYDNEVAGQGKAQTSGSDIDGEYGVTKYDSDVLAKGTTKGGNFKRTFTFKNGYKMSLVEPTAASRIGNPSNVRMEIRYGRDDTLFKLRQVRVDYIKVPQHIRLTQEQLDLTQDVSQMLEWPDYVCQEITNNLVKLIMERTADPRLANNIQINQSIARPQQAAGQGTQAAR